MLVGVRRDVKLVLGGTLMEDALARIHREYRDWCIERGTYRPFSERDFDEVQAKWTSKVKEEAKRPPRKHRKKPKGTAD